MTQIAGISSGSADTDRADATRWQRLRYVDVLITLSCIAVVALHVSERVFAPEPTPAWRHAVFIQAIAIFAVPIFFMISGMNNLNYSEKYSTRTFFARRVRRVGGALIFASIICYLILGLFSHHFHASREIAHAFSLKDFIHRFFTNRILPIYWFLYSIIYLYVFTPILNLVVKNKSRTEYFLALNFFIAFIIPTLRHVGVDDFYFSELVRWPAFALTPSFYYVAGYYLHNYVTITTRKSIFIPSAIAASLLIIATGYFWTLSANKDGLLPHEAKVDNFGVSCDAPHMAIYSIALFLIAKCSEPYFQRIPASLYKPISIATSCSFGIYLFHLLVYRFIPFRSFLDHSPVLYHAYIKIPIVWLSTAVLVYIFKRVRAVVRARVTAPLCQALTSS